MQSRPAPVLVDEFEVGLDRSNINKNEDIHLPVSQAKKTDNIENHAETDIDRSSAHHMVDSIKHHKHKAGIKIRKTLHIGKVSDDMSHETTVLANKPDQESDSRLVHDAPKPDKTTVKDFIHDPIDTISSKISGQSNKQFAGNVAAKEISHGEEVDLIRASEAAENAVSDAARLLAIKDLSKLMEERQATYVRWTFDRHITKVRELPRETMVLKPRTAFETYNPQEGVVIDWTAYGKHLLTYYANQYGGQYIGYGSDPPAPSKETIMPNVERLLVASSPIQEFIMTTRRVYLWENRTETTKYLVIYFTLWYFNLLLPGIMSAIVYLVMERHIHGNTIEDLREDVKRREDQRLTALSITELIEKEGDEMWSDKLLQELGPWLMVQLSDLANSFESMRNFYEWRVPHRTVRGLIVLCIVIVVTAVVPIWLLVKTMTFAAGASFFFLFPVATNFPEYRLLVSPIRRFLWNIPTHAEWAVKYVQAEAVRVAQTHTAVPAGTLPSPTFDPAYDYNAYTAHYEKTTGRLIIGATSVRFISNMGHKVHWVVPYDQIKNFEKQDRIVTKNIPSKLQRDSGKDLKFITKDGRELVLSQVDQRDEAFSQVVGFAPTNWQVVW